MSYGELVMVLGDMHVPHRASVVPDSFAKMLVPNKTQHLLCTGNLCSREQYDFLRTLAPSVHVVRGDMDELPELPEDTVVKIGDFKIGVCHGHQILPWGDDESLSIYARQLDVDILITGHTHKNTSHEIEGRLFINPGSITGAYSGPDKDVKPSFICMSIKGNNAVTYVYEIVDGEVVIQNFKFTKPSATTSTD